MTDTTPAHTRPIDTTTPDVAPPAGSHAECRGLLRRCATANERHLMSDGSPERMAELRKAAFDANCDALDAVNGGSQSQVDDDVSHAVRYVADCLVDNGAMAWWYQQATTQGLHWGSLVAALIAARDTLVRDGRLLTTETWTQVREAGSETGKTDTATQDSVAPGSELDRLNAVVLEWIDRAGKEAAEAARLRRELEITDRVTANTKTHFGRRTERLTARAERAEYDANRYARALNEEQDAHQVTRDRADQLANQVRELEALVRQLSATFEDGSGVTDAVEYRIDAAGEAIR